MNKIKKSIVSIPFLLIVISFTTMVKAEAIDGSPSSNVAWDAAAINFVKNGNASKGEELNKTFTCSVCHGEKGVSAARNWPNLAGQNPFYIYKQLLDFKDNKGSMSESAQLMRALSANLSKQDIADLAQYYANFSLPKPSNTSVQKLVDTEALKTIKHLVNKGDGKRMIASCAACHGHQGEGGKVDIPALTGQQAVYLRNTMQAFKTGMRNNDIYSRMRIIAKSITDDEINALAQYYAEMGSDKSD